MIIMMVSMMIVMKSEVWKRRLSFLHLSAPECQLKVAVVALIIIGIDHHFADYDYHDHHIEQYLQKLSKREYIFFLRNYNKENKQVGLSTLLWGSLLLHTASPIDAQTFGMFPR